MTKIWQVQEAKARFSALLDATLNDGPQVVSRRGEEVAVVVPLDEWLQLRGPGYTDIVDWLLADEARTDELTPRPIELTLPPAPDFE